MTNSESEYKRVFDQLLVQAFQGERQFPPLISPKEINRNYPYFIFRLRSYIKNQTILDYANKYNGSGSFRNRIIVLNDICRYIDSIPKTTAFDELFQNWGRIPVEMWLSKNSSSVQLYAHEEFQPASDFGESAINIDVVVNMTLPFDTFEIEYPQILAMNKMVT